MGMPTQAAGSCLRNLPLGLQGPSHGDCFSAGFRLIWTCAVAFLFVHLFLPRCQNFAFLHIQFQPKARSPSSTRNVQLDFSDLGGLRGCLQQLGPSLSVPPSRPASSFLALPASGSRVRTSRCHFRFFSRIEMRTRRCLYAALACCALEMLCLQVSRVPHATHPPSPPGTPLLSWGSLHPAQREGFQLASSGSKSPGGP